MIEKKGNDKTQLLTVEEQYMEDALSQGGYRRTSDFRETKKMYLEMAKLHKELQQTKKITIRVHLTDLLKLKAKAKRKNIPYQTLLSAVIRQYVEK